MSEFTFHNEETAPEASRELLADSKKSFGMVPNLHAVMAESPALLEGYKKVHELFAGSSFDNDELTVIWQSVNVENNCHYCVPAHTAIASSMKVSDDITEALRNETPLANPKLEALRAFTLNVLRNHGNVAEADVAAFFNAGYNQRHILEVILGISQKIMSNYTNHFANTPIDAPFTSLAWTKVAA